MSEKKEDEISTSIMHLGPEGQDLGRSGLVIRDLETGQTMRTHHRLPGPQGGQISNNPNDFNINLSNIPEVSAPAQESSASESQPFIHPAQPFMPPEHNEYNLAVDRDEDNFFYTPPKENLKKKKKREEISNKYNLETSMGQLEPIKEENEEIIDTTSKNDTNPPGKPKEPPFFQGRSGAGGAGSGGFGGGGGGGDGGDGDEENVDDVLNAPMDNREAEELVDERDEYSLSSLEEKEDEFYDMNRKSIKNLADIYVMKDALENLRRADYSARDYKITLTNLGLKIPEKICKNIIFPKTNDIEYDMNLPRKAVFKTLCDNIYKISKVFKLKYS